jgi:hypothetical protein
MARCRASRTIAALLTLAVGPMFAGSACGQTTPAAEGGLAGEIESIRAENAGMRAENAALRGEVRNLAEGQKQLLEMITGLQQRLNGLPVVSLAETRPVQPVAALVSAQVPISHVPVSQVPVAQVPVAQAPVAQAQATEASVPEAGPRYNDGVVLARTSEGAAVPFLVKLNDVTQFRFTNTQPNNSTFTDHLGVEHAVEGRNDFSLNRNLLMFNGYMFSKKLQYNLIVWASNSIASVIAGGLVSYTFNKAVTLNAGYWTVPGSRTLTQSFPYFIQLDRSMADNFFRPGFTQGVWGTGEPLTGLFYHVFVGNGLNTLTIPTAKIDRNLVYSGSVWWEPLGPYGPEGRARNMYDDYENHSKPVIRIGSSYTRSREDRFSNLDQSNPENTSMYNSDGVLTFATGAFARGVTLEEATYHMVAIDAGLKWRGLAYNGQFYYRSVNSFVADGPLPLSSMVDRGFDSSLSQFIVPRKVELYARTSYIFGQFGNSHEWAGGFKWYPVRNHRVWLVGEGLRAYKTPVGGIITPYTAGLTGWEPLMQLMFNF